MSVSFDLHNVNFEDESPLSSSDNSSDEHTVEERRIRVPNAFLTYRTEKHLALSSQLTKAIPFPNDLSRIIASWWHEAPDETKAYYRKLAYGDDADHNPRTMHFVRKRKRVPRRQKGTMEQQFCMGQFRVDLPRYRNLVQAANTLMGQKASPADLCVRPTIRHKKPLPLERYNCECRVCRLPTASIAKPYYDSVRKKIQKASQ